jgi:hypothetical protein
LNVKQHKPQAIAQVVWRSESEIGKAMPPPNSTSWAATARFTNEDVSELFSVVLYYRDSARRQETELHFFAPELVIPRLGVGSRLYITDGPRIMADAEILKVIE